jgi:hypothetical protein
MTKQARDNGLLPDADELEIIFRDSMDIFRVAFSSGPAAKLRPLDIKLTTDARPVRVKIRNYSQEQREFLSKWVTGLVRCGMAYSNPTSPWVCAPLLVPKPGPARYRFTVDLRPVNKYTVRHQYPVPNLENELAKLAGSRYYAMLDLSHGYWQLALSDRSQEYQSFLTPDRVYTPTRVLNGTTKAVTHLQSALGEILLTDLRSAVLYWLDDILLHASTVKGLLTAMRKLFGMCAEYNLKLHPNKCILYATEITWCGRLVSANGLRYDPRQLDGLLSMEPPVTGGLLQQFVYAMQWLKHDIPEFSKLMTPLREFKERVYNRSGKRTRRAVARIPLPNLGWSETERSSFEQCKQVLAKLPSHTMIHSCGCASTPTCPIRYGRESSPKFPARTLARPTLHNAISRWGSCPVRLTRPNMDVPYWKKRRSLLWLHSSACTGWPRHRTDSTSTLTTKIWYSSSILFRSSPISHIPYVRFYAGPFD